MSVMMTNKWKKTVDSQLILQRPKQRYDDQMSRRWQNAYDLFVRGDHINSLNVFELIELTCSEIPKEISFNRILALIASKQYNHTVEVGSKLLRSSLGPFFLFALGIHQEVVNPEQSLLSFKKCLLSLKDLKKVEMEGNYWTVTKFMVYINLAIMSNIAEDEKLANLYLLKAQEMSEDDDSQNIAKVYLEKGLKGVRCIGFPKDFCIPPNAFEVKEIQDHPSVSIQDRIEQIEIQEQVELENSNEKEEGCTPATLNLPILSCIETPTIGPEETTLANSTLPLQNESKLIAEQNDMEESSNDQKNLEIISFPIDIPHSNLCMLPSPITEKDEKVDLVYGNEVDQRSVNHAPEFGLQVLVGPMNVSENCEKSPAFLLTPPDDNQVWNELYDSSDAACEKSVKPGYLQKLFKSFKTHRSSSPNLNNPVVQSLPLGNKAVSSANCVDFSHLPVNEQDGEYLDGTARVKIFGKWYICAAQNHNKILTLYDVNNKTSKLLELTLDKQCRIEPEIKMADRKMNVFNLYVGSDQYTFCLNDLQTTLTWITKIIKMCLDIPSSYRNIEILRTGLGREPFKPK